MNANRLPTRTIPYTPEHQAAAERWREGEALPYSPAALGGLLVLAGAGWPAVLARLAVPGLEPPSTRTLLRWMRGETMPTGLEWAGLVAVVARGGQ